MTPLIATVLGLAMIADSGDRPGLGLLGGAVIVLGWIYGAWAVSDDRA